jgi:hypothetical protein
MENAKRPGSAMDAEPGLSVSGAGGNRTRVRLQIPRGVYVRIPLFCSPRPLIGQWEAPREPAVKISPAPSRRQTQASQNLMTPAGPPQAGLTGRREVRKPKRSLLTQPERSYRSRLLVSRRFYEVSEDLGTQPRLHHTRRNLDSPKPVFSTDASNLQPLGHPVNPLAPQQLTPAPPATLPLCRPQRGNARAPPAPLSPVQAFNTRKSLHLNRLQARGLLWWSTCGPSRVGGWLSRFSGADR